jgi:hypothetical protein
VELVSALGIRSVAEGVESADVAAALAAMGCDAAQGWHFSRPLNAASATAWLAERAGPAVALPPPEPVIPAPSRKPATATTPPTGWLARPGA